MAETNRLLIRIAILMAATFLVGCSSPYYFTEAYDGIGGYDQYRTYVTFCVSDVEYIRTKGGITGHFKEDGSLHTCKTDID